MFSTSGDVQYIWGCSVHLGDHEYIGDVQNTGGYHGACGGYHECIKGTSLVHWGVFSTSGGYHDACGGASS